jgi:hypothetical protein
MFDLVDRLGMESGVLSKKKMQIFAGLDEPKVAYRTGIGAHSHLVAASRFGRSFTSLRHKTPIDLRNLEHSQPMQLGGHLKFGRRLHLGVPSKYPYRIGPTYRLGAPSFTLFVAVNPSSSASCSVGCLFLCSLQCCTARGSPPLWRHLGT